MKQVFLETKNTTRVKVIPPTNSRATHNYLRAQSTLLANNASLCQELKNLENTLNYEVACDVAVGTLSILTVDEVSTPDQSSSSAASLLGNVLTTMPNNVGAFWDPSTIGYHLPIHAFEGDSLYYGAEASPVGIEGTGTVVDETVRCSNEMRLSRYTKETFRKLNEKVDSDISEAIMKDTHESVNHVLGHGMKPIDENVASYPTLRIPPALLFFQFPDEVENIRQKLCPLSPNIRVVPYKVVVYGQEDFFLPHVDSMDHNALQFGSLAVQLPTEYPDNEESHTKKEDASTPSQLSGELVFFLGRELDPEEKQFDSSGKFKNKSWVSYSRPKSDEEQLRIRVDLTTHLPAIPITRPAVKKWLLTKKGIDVKPLENDTTETYQFKVQPLKYAAWQGDIPHEVTRITNGYRAVVLYRLIKDFTANPEVSKNASNLSFLSEQSRETVSKYSKEASGIRPFALYPRVSDLKDENTELEHQPVTIWERFMSQTKTLQTYHHVSYRSVINAHTRNTIHTHLAKVFHHLCGVKKPIPLPAGMEEGTPMLETVVSHLSRTTYTDKLLAEGASDVTHIAFVLRHQYPAAVQRILHELQNGANCKATMTAGERARMTMSLLKGGDAVLFALLSEVSEVSIHAVHQVKSDFPSAPYRVASHSQCPWYGNWIQRSYPSEVDLASDLARPNETGVKKMESQIELDAERAMDNASELYPTFVDCAWVSMGLGKLIAGGHSYGNADCGADWWYRSSVMIVNPFIPSRLFWRRRMLLWALRRGKTSSRLEASSSIHPLVLSLRILLQHPDLFIHICNFL